MNSNFNTHVPRADKQVYGYTDNKMGLALQQESLFSLAMYDMDSVATNLQKQDPPAQPTQSAAFHPVDEYKDMSLRELLDLSDDYLFDDAESNMNHSLNPIPVHSSQSNMLRQVSSEVQSMGSYSDTTSTMRMVDQADLEPNQVFSMGSPSASSSKKKRRRQVSDDENSESDDLNDEGRFRPYQAGQWAERFDDLCKFREQTGNCLVPHTFKENLPLARWVKRQRYQYKLMQEGKPSTMTQERVRALEDIGFIWDSQGAAWGERLDELKEFRKVYMHCNVPSNYSENPQLATWVKCQRRQYKLHSEGKPSNMTQQRIHELEGIGFEWLLRSYKRSRTC